MDSGGVCENFRFYYVSALGTAQWLNLSDYRPVVWPIGILIVIFSLWSLPTASVDVSRNDINVFPLQGMFDANDYSSVIVGDCCCKEKKS